MSNENTLIVRDSNGNRLTIKDGGTLKIEDGALVENGNSVVAGSEVTVENQLGVVQHTRITLTDKVVSTTDNTTAGANGSFDLCTLPRGNIYMVGAVSNLTLVGDGTGLAATAAVVSAIGSVAADNANGTLTSTEADIIPSTTSTLSGSAGVMKGKSTTPKMFDNTTTTNATQLKPKLNFAVPDAGTSANGSLTVTGTVDLWWINFGDN